MDGHARLGLAAFAQIDHLRIREAPQPQPFLRRADQLLVPWHTLAVDRDQIILLAGEQVGTVQDEQRLPRLHGLPGLVDEQLLDVGVVLQDDVSHLGFVHLYAPGGP